MFGINIYNYYLSKIFIKKFFVTFFAVIAIIYISNIFDLLQKFKSHYVTISQFWHLSLYKLPYIFNEVGILVSFIATLLFLKEISNSNELLIFLNFGISIWRILIVPIIINFILGIIFILLIEPLSPYALKKFDKLEAKITGKTASNLIISDAGIFISEKNSIYDKIFQVGSIDVNHHKLNAVIILVKNKNNEFLYRIDSKEAVIKDKKLFFPFARLTFKDRTHDINNYSIDSKLDISQIIHQFKPPIYVGLWQLKSVIKNIEASGLSTIKYKLHYYKQLLKPFYFLAMSLIACLIIGLNLRENNNKKFATSLILGIASYLFLELIFRILSYSGLSPFLSVMLPLLFIILLSNFVILHLQEA